MRRLLVVVSAAALALLLPTVAQAARFAVGVRPHADRAALSSALERRTGHPVEDLAPVRALIVRAATPRGLRLPGVRYVERLGVRRLAFTPTDPLVVRQWYLAQNRSYDAWPDQPALQSVRVAVIDSGVDAEHPELAGRVAQSESFVGGGPNDIQGHGTIVAGVIAAQTGNDTGIAGLAPSAELLVAKVVTARRTIPVEAEAKAIRWAVENGARVINMSLGGLRDPRNTHRDTYSRLEADAVAYAVSKDVVVVAAVGNSDQAPARPWRFASYPAALPHVLGVSALARDGSSPEFSNRDPIYNDLAAPGEDVLSLFPRAITADRPACVEQGYTPCATDEFRAPEGTSFAAPQVSAAAANLIATQPLLRSDQVVKILQRTAVDATAANGCRPCAIGRDPLTGWGRLDAAAALGVLAGTPPVADAFEANDEAGSRSYRLYGDRRAVRATLDYWDDPDDVYKVFVRRGDKLFVSLTDPAGEGASLGLWAPGTEEVTGFADLTQRLRLRTNPGPTEYLPYYATRTGWYYVHVHLLTQGFGQYRLFLQKTR
ncbi:MAG TPA: S8 family serine peptidase [Gaiellaceae bacterium]|nr:S8 family serine peptidase [Gaiellaceae bacterium]